MIYTIEFTSKAERQFKKLPEQLQKKLTPKLDALAKTPRPSGIKKLEGGEDLYRIHIGDYCFIYQIQDDQLILLVIKIGDRKEIYKK
ncbi:MAG: type II toxin-antitoxin system RelE/ParE family toxin [Acidobacteria bacterium]|nr:type II toxin-antitoxin system RelE/ParE family toxin [Acidobacteriota bacterium]